jgi:hypothetical protein
MLMDLVEELTHLLENAPGKEIFNLLDARHEARQQKEGVENC